MSIIIGALSTCSFAGCVVSVNWGASPNTQRLYCLGDKWEADPSRVFKKPTATLSITCYAPGPSYTCTPTTSCTFANKMGATVSPAGCGGGGEGPASTSWYVTSYSFSKDDPLLPGQESWSMMDYIGDNLPSAVLRGVAEGSGSPKSGVNFKTVDGSATTGSVSAGGFGRADTLSVGVVDSVGGGTSTKGETGQGSVSIPYTPLYY